jgi:hypothetical protein
VNPHEAIMHAPTTLSALEAAIGQPLRRGDKVEDLYLVRRDNPFDGVKLIYVSFIGRELATDPDPAIAEIRWLTYNTDMRAAAAKALGPGVSQGGGEQHDEYLGHGHEGTPLHQEWRDARGEWNVYEHDTTCAFWKLRDPPLAETRSPQEEAELVDKIVALANRRFGLEALEEAFGPIGIDGRWPLYFARGASWLLQAHSVLDLRDVTITLGVPIPAQTLVTALGLGEWYVDTGDAHGSNWSVHLKATKREPGMACGRIEIGVGGPKAVQAHYIRIAPG